MTSQPTPPFGVYTPVVCFFNDDESINFDAVTQHIQRLLSSGVAGLVIHGSNGEATHLFPEEKIEVIRHARKLITEAKSNAVIISGCSANSARETVRNIETAKEAGADFALVLPPSYWAAAMSKPVIRTFYLEVSSQRRYQVL
jgi:2-keto-3-deoxy-L-rhamnonate aldolase